MKNRICFFWRDSNGNEVDIIAGQNGRLMPIEIKSGKTLTKDSFKGLNKWLSLAQDTGVNPTLIYAGKEHYQRQNIQVTGWEKLDNIL